MALPAILILASYALALIVFLVMIYISIRKIDAPNLFLGLVFFIIFILLVLIIIGIAWPEYYPILGNLDKLFP